MDIFEKCYGFTEAKEAIEAGIYPYFIPLTANEGTEAVFRGHRLIMCGSNNYLGLTTDPRVRQAAIEAIQPLWDELHRLALPERHTGDARGPRTRAG
jgi:8-amino-7-oxononanoate synthase